VSLEREVDGKWVSYIKKNYVFIKWLKVNLNIFVLNLLYHNIALF